MIRLKYWGKMANWLTQHSFSPTFYIIEPTVFITVTTTFPRLPHSWVSSGEGGPEKLTLVNLEGGMKPQKEEAMHRERGFSGKHSSGDTWLFQGQQTWLGPGSSSQWSRPVRSVVPEVVPQAERPQSALAFSQQFLHKCTVWILSSSFIHLER